MLQIGRHSARFKALRARARRRQPGEVVVDGRRLIGDLVAWDVPVRELYLTPDLAQSPEAKAWAEAAGQVFELEPGAMAAAAPTRSPQGVLAVVAEPRWPPWKAAGGVGLWLDTVQDPGNLGAIVRVAAGLGAAAVLASPGCADTFHPAAVRGSAGAVFRLPVEAEVGHAQAVARVRAAGGEVWAASRGGVPLRLWNPPRPVLVLFGSEGRGLPAAAVEDADGVVTVPLERGIESLNVAVAAGIVLARLRGD